VSRYRISRAAQQDLDAIWCYIGSSDLAAADRWVDNLEERFHVLARQPHAGKARPDLAPEVRFLPVGNYLIFYRPAEDGVEIIRIVHGSRDYGPEYF
jgi:toxin ParE1/3/4